MDNIVAIILAAGMGARMGGPNKLLLPFRGRPLIAWAAEAARASQAARAIIVTGRDGDEVAAAAGEGFTRVHNSDFEAGLASSLRLGLEAAKDADAALILLGDMPRVTAALIDTLIEAWPPNAYALAPEKNGALGNPVILSRAAMADCATLSGDRGARALIEKHPALARIAIDDDAIFKDVDTPGDLF